MFFDYNDNIIEFPTNHNNNRFHSNLIVQEGNDGTKDVNIIVPLKYLSNFWKTLGMPLINCEINLTLT